MVGRYRFEFILIILILCALIAAVFIFPDRSYLILLPLSSRPVYSIYEGLLLIIIITHQSVICVQPLL
ncbi:Uncharacterised protein [Escherichia coli]|uniref:Uncharacterized protein n=1 Tax=Escherichia coli TaxID=562 RepID=A0A376LNN9_ECOLX|nr:Uncharacterised protein [Escherichia coli]